jgi:hypothetical protein
MFSTDVMLRHAAGSVPVSKLLWRDLHMSSIPSESIFISRCHINLPSNNSKVKVK